MTAKKTEGVPSQSQAEVAKTDHVFRNYRGALVEVMQAVAEDRFGNHRFYVRRVSDGVGFTVAARNLKEA